jgi:predicted transcriptional regulator
MFTNTQAKVVLILLDDKGHAEWELAKNLDKEDSNLNPILKKLRQMGIIIRGDPRKSGKEIKRNAEYREVPYYLEKSIDALRRIIKEIAESKNEYDAGFILHVLRKSKYLEVMREKYGEDVNKSIVEVLRSCYPPLGKKFITDVIKLSPEEIFLPCIKQTPKGLELWYFRYSLKNPSEDQINWSTYINRDKN